MRMAVWLPMDIKTHWEWSHWDIETNRRRVRHKVTLSKCLSRDRGRAGSQCLSMNQILDQIHWSSMIEPPWIKPHKSFRNASRNALRSEITSLDPLSGPSLDHLSGPTSQEDTGECSVSYGSAAEVKAIRGRQFGRHPAEFQPHSPRKLIESNLIDPQCRIWFTSCSVPQSRWLRLAKANIHLSTQLTQLTQVSYRRLPEVITCGSYPDITRGSDSLREHWRIILVHQRTS